jgi:hypothetical protein
VALAGRGKRGGARVIYMWRVSRSRILLLYAYRKNEMEDLTPDQLAELVATAAMEIDDETASIQ